MAPDEIGYVSSFPRYAVRGEHDGYAAVVVQQHVLAYVTNEWNMRAQKPIW